ncbi:MAG: response regulator transcription factor [Sandaracinaceae bacterium]
MASRILLVDDDTELVELLRHYLAKDGFEIDAVHDGELGLERARSNEHDVVVLDVMLPRMNGLDVLRALRATSLVPVIMLTARGEDVDRIVGLEMGADDYLPKPFNPRELSARIRALIRRSEATASHGRPQEVIAVDDLTMDLGAWVVRRGGERVDLTSVEFAVLELLLRSLGQVVTREAISESALGRRLSPYDRSIDVHMSNLRKKLGPRPGGGARIKTIRGAGYVLVGPER